ncbi:unnamed protein product [Symbiodinium sp. CCMP2592]|nr:unnamed protein product [Symbiodinium sp. CCMP2592]
MSDLDCHAPWHHIQESSSEGDEIQAAVFRKPPAPQSPRQSITRGTFAFRTPPKPKDKRLRRLVQAERQELRVFLHDNPCPAKRLVQQWLLDAASSAVRGEPKPRTLAGMLECNGWTYESLGWFHYRSFADLWRSGTTAFAASVDAQRAAGICLYQRGGRECMQFNYYVLHYAMCGEDFVANPPLSAFGFVNRIEKAWDGIGSWKA